MNNQMLEMYWNESLSLWEGAARIEMAGQDQAVGPAGAAGVAVAFEPDCSVSVSIEGRLVSVWIDPDATPRAMALFNRVVGPIEPSLKAPPATGTASQQVPQRVLSAEDRSDAVREVLIGDYLNRYRHTQSGQGSAAARFLALIEYAALHPVWDELELIHFNELSSAEELASRALVRLTPLKQDLGSHQEFVGWLPAPETELLEGEDDKGKYISVECEDGSQWRWRCSEAWKIPFCEAERLVTQDGLVPANYYELFKVYEDEHLQTIVDSLTKIVNRLEQRSGQDSEALWLLRQVLDYQRKRINQVQAPALGGRYRGGVAVLDREDELVVGPLAAESTGMTRDRCDADPVYAVHDDHGLRLNAADARRVGIEPSVGVERLGGWVKVGVQAIGDGGDVPSSLWADALDIDDKIIGCAPFPEVGMMRNAHVAIGEVEVYRWRLGVRDLRHFTQNRPAPQVLVHATNLARAGWCAYRTGRTTSKSEMMLSQAVVEWLSLGMMYRASWAFCATRVQNEWGVDRDLVRSLLGERHEELVATLETIARTGDLPSSKILRAVDPPLFWYVVKTEELPEGVLGV